MKQLFKPYGEQLSGRGNSDKGPEILKQNNICNINSSMIGYIYAIELKKPEEAENYFISSMSEIINQVIRTVSGMAFVYAQANDEACISIALWLMNFFDSLKADAAAIIFLEKFKAILMAQCAVWEASFGYLDEEREHIIDAYVLAKKFDEPPIYTMQGIKIFQGMETERVSFDGICKTAMEAVENFVFGKTPSSKAEKQIKEQWEELKSGCTDA